MLELLTSFSAMTLISGAVLSLLPEGSIRRTAGMVIGLMTLMLWADGLASLKPVSQTESAPQTPLTASGENVTRASAEAAQALRERLEGIK